MGRALVLINSDQARTKVILWATKAPWNTRVTFQAPKRTLPQNDRMWAMLTDISVQIGWHGRKLAPAQWKRVFTDGLRRELDFVPSLDGRGVVALNDSTSDMSVEEMSDLIELLFAWGSANGVKWSEPKAEPQALTRTMETA